MHFNTERPHSSLGYQFSVPETKIPKRDIALGTKMGADQNIWQFTGGKTLVNHHKTIKTIQAKSAEAEAMCKDLIGRGFKFVGPMVCYAFMHAAGLVNDHAVDCFR